MAETIKGINILIGSDTTGLSKALSDVNKNARDIQSELKQVEKLLKLDPTNTDLLAQKQKLLTEAIANSGEKLNRLKAAQEQVNDQFKKGDITEGQYRAFQREVVAAEQELKRFESRIAETKKTANDLGATLAKTGDKMKGVGEKMSVAVTAPIAAVGGLMLKGAMDAEAATGKLQAQLGLTAEQAADLGVVAESVWVNGFGENIGEATNAVKRVRQNMKVMAEDELQKVTEAAMTIADLFEGDVQLSTYAAGVMMKNFGIDGQTAMDLITVGFQRGGDYSGELLDTLREYSPQFATMGMSADQMMGILIAGAETGAWNMDKVGDAVKEFNIRAKDGSKTTAEGFAAIGLNANDMGQAIAQGGEKGQKAFTATIAALAAMKDPVERNAAGVALFGTQWEDLESKVVIAMAKGVKGIGEFQGANAAAAKAAYDNNPGMQLTNAMRDLSKAIGPAITPLANIITDTVVPAVKEMADWFKNLSPEGQKVAIAIAGVAAAIGPALIVIGSMASGLSSVVGVVGTLIPELASLVLGIGPIGAAIAAAVVVGVLLYKNWDTISAKAAELWAWMGEVWEGIKISISNAINAVKTTISGVWDGITSITSEAWGGIKSFFIYIWEGIKTVFFSAFEAIRPVLEAGWNAIKATVTAVWETIKTYLQTTWEIIKTIFAAAFLIIYDLITGNWDEIGKVFTAAWNKIKNLTDDAWKHIKDVWGDAFRAIADFTILYWENVKRNFANAWESLKKGASEAWGALKYLFVDGWEGLKQGVIDSWEAIKRFFADGWDNLVDSVYSGMNKVHATVVDLWDNVVTFFKQLPGQALEWGKDIIRGLWEGISNLDRWLYDKVARFVKNNVIDTVKNFLGIASPSKVMEDFGRMVSEGMAIGIEKNKDRVYDATKLLSDTVISVADAMVKDLSVAVGNVDKEFKIWQLTAGKVADETQKLGKEKEILTQKLSIAADQVAVVDTALQKLRAEEGANTAAITALEGKLLDARIAYLEIANSIQGVNENLVKQQEETGKAKNSLDAMAGSWDSVAAAAIKAGLISPSVANTAGGGGNSGVGYLYTDQYDISHVVRDYATAAEFSGGGSITFYTGAFGGGYAYDKNGNTSFNTTPTGSSVFGVSTGETAGGYAVTTAQGPGGEAGYDVPGVGFVSAHGDGAIVPGPRLSVIGEVPEAVLPLSLLVPLMTDALLGATKKLSGTSASAPAAVGRQTVIQVINHGGTIVGRNGMEEFARTVSRAMGKDYGLSTGGVF